MHPPHELNQVECLAQSWANRRSSSGLPRGLTHGWPWPRLPEVSLAALLTQVLHKYSGSSVGGSELGAGRAGLTQLSSREGFLLSVLSFPFREIGFPVLF